MMLAVVFAAQVYGQSAAQNYLRSRAPLTKITTSARLDQLTPVKDSVETVINYTDGLDRPLQTIQVRGTAAGNDLIQPFAYDALGRQAIRYAPYSYNSAAPGSYQANALADNSGVYTNSQQYLFYQASGRGYAVTLYPSATTAFEPSPLNRPVEQGSTGSAWQLSNSGVTGSGHTVKMVYTSNNSIAWTTDSVNSRQVALYNATINSDQSRTLTAAGYYSANTLHVTIIKDENWVSGRAGTVEEYKDMSGRVVLKRQYNYGTTLQVLSTYYLYDDKGLLAFVLPPAANGDAAAAISQSTLDNLCYQYRYDKRDRLSKKKIPGKGWEYVVYNLLDQPVATQDANQRAGNQWLFTKYDALGRTVMTGIWNNGGIAITQDSLQNRLTAITTNLYEAPVASGNGYTNVAWPWANITATLSLDYYDGYSNVPGLSATPYGPPAGASTQTRGLSTARLRAILNTPSNMLWSVSYYDDPGRNIKRYDQHYLGGTLNNSNYDAITTLYNFSNAATKVTRQHWNTSSAASPLLTIVNTYLYDHTGRRIKNWEQIANGTSALPARTLISKIDYNEIGQVLSKHLHSTDSINFYQNIAYTYNERGWLLSSTAPLFAMQLYYNTGTANKAYNGNIMYQYWGTASSLTKYYQYSYDKLDRLLSGVASTSNNETIAYDQSGNITSLNRYTTGTLTDQLAYSYTNGAGPTNQLQGITDNSGSNTGLASGITNYTYDANGNELTQTNAANNRNNKTFTYNLLNLPQTVVANTGPATTTTLSYTYDAAGNIKKDNGA